MKQFSFLPLKGKPSNIFSAWKRTFNRVSFFFSLEQRFFDDLNLYDYSACNLQRTMILHVRLANAAMEKRWTAVRMRNEIRVLLLGLLQATRCNRVLTFAGDFVSSSAGARRGTELHFLQELLNFDETTSTTLVPPLQRGKWINS